MGVGSWVAIGVGSTEGPRKPLASKKRWVVEIPSVGVFVADRIAEGQTGFARLVRQIPGQIDHSGAISPLGVVPDLFEHIAALANALVPRDDQFDHI
jgi:hypothetical protein